MIRYIFLLSILAFCVSCNNPKATDSTADAVGNKATTETPSSASAADEKEYPKVMTEATLDLTKYGIANNPNNVLGGLKVGDRAPDIELGNQYGRKVSMEDKLGRGPVLVVFFRADWCGYCTKHLADFQERIKEFDTAGNARVLAISPQLPKYTQKLFTDNMFTFPILYDENHQTMKDYKVFYHVTDAYNEKVLKHKGERIETMNGDAEPVLPVPASFLVGQDQTIKWVHYDPDYSKRGDVGEMIEAL